MDSIGFTLFLLGSLPLATFLTALAFAVTPQPAARPRDPDPSPTPGPPPASPRSTFTTRGPHRPQQALICTCVVELDNRKIQGLDPDCPVHNMTEHYGQEGF